MEIHPSIHAIDLGLYLSEHKVLIICDVHVGYEDSLVNTGLLLPAMQAKDIKDRLAYLFAKVPVDTLVINGDFKHQFGRSSRQEWKESIDILEFATSKVKKVILVQGNHDPAIHPIARRVNCEVVQEFCAGNILVTHGDEVPARLADVIIMGHEHPAIVLRDKAKSEKYKCFLKGKFMRKVLIVQPSFHVLTQGTNVLTEKLLSPLIGSIGSFEVFIVDDVHHEVLRFGKVRDLE